MKKNYISDTSFIGENVKLIPPVRLYGTARVNRDSSISSFSYIESRTTIYPGTTIGKFCSIGKSCQIGVIAHPINWLSTSPFQYNFKYHFPDYPIDDLNQKEFKRPMKTKIGNDVWIGANAIIKRGIKIGNGAIIATGAVVIRDVEPYSIVGGVPAKLIKYRFDCNTISKLLKLKWWELPIKKLSKIDFNNINKAIEQLEKIIKANKKE